MLATLLRGERAQGLTEYAVLVGVIVLGIAAMLLLLRGAVTHQHAATMKIERPAAHADNGNDR